MCRKIFKINFSRKEDIGKILGEMLIITGNQESFLKSTGDNMTYQWVFHPLEIPTPYRIDEHGHAKNIYIKEVGLNVNEDVFYFVKKVLGFGLQEQLDKVIYNIGNLQKKLKSVWVDTETIFGSDYAAILAILDIHYLPGYTWFIKQLYQDDLDHEILQIEAVEALLEKHGYREETLNHLIELASRTQAGMETLWICSEKQDFAGYLKNNNKFEWFKNRIEEAKVYEGMEEDKDTVFDNIASNLTE
ncbi:MAG: hypothetical protein ACOCVN_02380 [bacterium]